MLIWNSKRFESLEDMCGKWVFFVPKEFYTCKRDYGSDAKLVTYLVSRVDISMEMLRNKNDFECLFMLYTPLLGSILNYCEKNRKYEEIILELMKEDAYEETAIKTAISGLYNLRILGFADDMKEVARFQNEMRTIFKASPLSTEILYSYIYKKYGVPYMFAPSKFAFVVTNKCNARCNTCYRGRIETDKSLKYDKELTTQEIFEVIQYLHRIGTDRIKFLGGEPFCRNDIFEILEFAQSLNMITEISTNALALAEEANIRKLKKLNACLLNIQISIDGMENGHNLQRVGADFHTVVKAMDNLFREHIAFSTNTIVSRINKNEIEEFLCFLSKYHIVSRFQIMKACGMATENLENILTPEEKKDVINVIDEAALKYKVNVKNSIVFHPFVHEDTKAESEHPAVYHRCRSCTYGMAINPEGYALPCEFLEPFPSFRCENVKDKSILDIWHENDIFKKLRYIKVQGKCAECEYSSVCEMGCFAETLGLTGSIEAADPVCWYEPGSKLVSFPQTNDYIKINCEREMAGNAESEQ